MIDQEISQILSALASDYSVESADCPKSVREALHLRHQVFCQERGVIPGPGGDALETDQYDSRSRHIILRRKIDGISVGTVRLVLGALDDPERRLPIQRYADAGILADFPARSVGEISRFALSARRRRPGAPSDTLLRLGLMQGILQVSAELGLTHWAAVMEPALIRLLRSTGVRFRPLGPMVEAFGLRQPAIARIESVLASGQVQQPEFYRYVTGHPAPLPATAALAA